jgi:general secretion pathway protein F
MPTTEYKLLNDKSAQTRRATAGSRSSAAKRKADICSRVRTADLCAVTRQLATLLRAGMPVVPALSALTEQLHVTSGTRWYSKNDSLAGIIRDVRDDVNEGSTLSDALAGYPNVFSPLFVNMVAAGEASGTLEDVLLNTAQMLEKRVDLAGKVKTAVAYPLMMTAVAAGVVVFLLSYVVPGITQIFLEMDRALPWPTRFLIATSSFVRHYFVVITIAAFAGFFAVAAACRTDQGKVLADRFKLALPLFGKLFLKLEIARLTRTLAILLTSGIPILSSLDIVKGVVRNSIIAKALDSVKEAVGRGDNIANAIRRTGLFPPIVFHITATAQAGANMEQALENLADMYDREVENTARVLTSLVEPVVLLVMGIVVGFIVLAILMPIFEINQML